MLFLMSALFGYWTPILSNCPAHPSGLARSLRDAHGDVRESRDRQHEKSSAIYYDRNGKSRGNCSLLHHSDIGDCNSSERVRTERQSMLPFGISLLTPVLAGKRPFVCHWPAATAPLTTAHKNKMQHAIGTVTAVSWQWPCRITATTRGQALWLAHFVRRAIGHCAASSMAAAVAVRGWATHRAYSGAAAAVKSRRSNRGRNIRAGFSKAP